MYIIENISNAVISGKTFLIGFRIGVKKYNLIPCELHFPFTGYMYDSER
jgi:hypothetical protein